MKTSRDILWNGKLILEQPQKGYRAGFDPFLLSAFAPGQPNGAEAIDLGCGVGTVFLSLCKRQPQLKFTAVDLAPDFCQLAQSNAFAKGLNKVEIHNADIRHLAEQFDEESFELVLANPPFYPAGSGRLSKNEKKAAANHELFGNLQDWLSTGYLLTKTRGCFCLIHLAERKDECLNNLVSRFNKIEWLWVKPKASNPAIRVLIRAYKENPRSVQQLPDLILHEEDGSLTPQASQFLETPASMEF